MKKVVKIIALAFVLSVALSSYSTANAETKIAVLNMQKIVETASVYKDVRAQVEDIGKNFDTSTQKKIEDLNKEDQALTAQKVTLSPQEYEKKRADLQNRFQTFQRTAQKQRTDMQRNIENLQLRVQDQIQKVVTTISKEKNYDIIVERTMIHYASPNVPDITDDVIKGLNAALPKLKVPAI